MDWLDEKVKGWVLHWTNLNLEKSLRFYILTAVIGICAASLLTIQICSGWKRLIEEPHLKTEKLQVYDENGNYLNNIEYGIYTSDMGDYNVFLIEVLGFIQEFCVVIYSVIAVVLLTRIYYRNRLKEPIRIMSEAAEHIAENDLSYSCYYDSSDEMGNLCRNLDDMRQRLIMHKESVWNQMEDQKTLNAAFAHDMRTPLTVLQGYVDLLVRYYPEGNITEEKMMEILHTMQGHLNRLEHFGNTMKEIRCLEEREPRKKEVKIEKLEKKLREITGGLELRTGIKIILECRGNGEEAMLDIDFVLETAENLLSNALRYAKSRIDVVIEYEEERSPVRIYVRDNGKGFTQTDMKKAPVPYYRDQEETQGSNEHFGIGLSICRLLCRKHDGELELSNSIDGGAIVCAVFR